VSTLTNTDWETANQRYLSAAIAVLRECFDPSAAFDDADEELKQAAAAMPAPAAIDFLTEALALSPFERDVLLMCAGVELDSTFATALSAVQSESGCVHPTFGTALGFLPEAHWSALAPTAPLRRWRLIELGEGLTLATSPLHIDERVLHYLAGLAYVDERLSGFVEPISTSSHLAPTHVAIAWRIVDAWSRSDLDIRRPVVLVGGSGDAETRRAIAASASAEVGLRIHAIRATDIPTSVAERDLLARLWDREAILGASILLLECDEVDPAESRRAVLPFVRSLRSTILVSSREALQGVTDLGLRVEVPPATTEEQRALWQSVLGEASGVLNGQVDSIAEQFRLGPRAMQAACSDARSALGFHDGTTLWDAARAQARPRLDDLAERVVPTAGWEHLVLPEPQLDTLRAIAVHVCQRGKVYRDWGFAGRDAGALGISALFVGPSGTGKTMAAEVLARELRLDLYRIDLSSVVSKYIGETEKNLRRLFDAAEEGGAILLFDEADALFGKRSEVKDSHDRYANIEISYLLQRMEAYRGLAILTTNMKSALDSAFWRRLRFVVNFPFPDPSSRAEIWRRVFPSDTPTADLDIAKLARLTVTGGTIRNIALSAAFLAANRGDPVRMRDLDRAARRELAKLERPAAESELGGWA
jgi:ATPase family associated with various cellular activities (AAA)